MTTENTTESSPELVISSTGGYHAWWPATKADDDFRAAVAERGTPRARALYAALQKSSRQTLPRKYRRCTSQDAEG